MNCSDLGRHFARAFPVRRCFESMASCIALVVFVPCAIGEAAPVTLQFEGTIGPPRAGTALIDLPFSFTEGDTIRGSFTFEPVGVESSVDLTESPQSFISEFEINGFKFKTSSYLMVSVNDTAITTEPDVDPPPQDGIVLTCSLGTDNPCIPKAINGSGSAEFEFFLRVVGPENVLDGADIPSDAGVWNSLNSERVLNLNFRHPATNEFYQIDATIDSFATVPEPANSFLFIIVASAAYRHRPRRRATALSQ